MKSIKIRYLILIISVIAIILIAGGHQLPKYASRIIALSVLAVVDMLYWLSVRKSITRRFSQVLKLVYWFPMVVLLVFFITGAITPYYGWPTFLRIYFSGVLLVLLIGKGIFLAFLIAGDIILFPINIFRGFIRKNHKSRQWFRPKSFLLFSSGLATLVMLIYFSGMFFWVSDFKLTTINLKINNLPEEFEGYRIIQLSDMHLGSFLTVRPLSKILKISNDQHPDVILFTGDLVNFSTCEAYPFEVEMKKFSAKDGIYSILGNHDYGEYTQWDSEEAKGLNDKALFAFYKRINWILLRNQNVIIRRDSASIAILGVENWSLTKRFGKKGDIKKALSGADSTQFKILMSHDPTHWDGEINKYYPQIALTFSGHTHAFQLAIETGSTKWSPASMLFKEWGGLYEKVHGNGVIQYLYVNRGVGTLGYPGRIGTRPEITLIVLHRAD